MENNFNYPYGTLYTLADSSEMDIYKDRYELTPQVIQELTKVDINPPEGQLQYQEAVNICGDAIKYIYGYTAHSNNKALAIYHPADNNYEYGMNYVYYYDGTADFTVWLDPQTGKILDFKSDEHINFTADKGGKSTFINEIPDDRIKAKFEETVLKDLEILGYKDSIDAVKFVNTAITARSSYDWYNTTVILSNGRKCSVGYSTIDDDYFELGRFTLRY